VLLTLTQVTLGAEAGVAVGGLGRQYEAAVSVNATSLVKGNLLTDVQATSCYCVSKVRHFLDKFLLRSVCRLTVSCFTQPLVVLQLLQLVRAQQQLVTVHCCVDIAVTAASS
jgi:hypothetical protein